MLKPYEERKCSVNGEILVNNYEIKNSAKETEAQTTSAEVNRNAILSTPVLDKFKSSLPVKQLGIINPSKSNFVMIKENGKMQTLECVVAVVNQPERKLKKILPKESTKIHLPQVPKSIEKVAKEPLKAEKKKKTTEERRLRDDETERKRKEKKEMRDLVKRVKDRERKERLAARKHKIDLKLGRGTVTEKEEEENFEKLSKKERETKLKALGIKAFKERWDRTEGLLWNCDTERWKESEKELCQKLREKYFMKASSKYQIWKPELFVIPEDTEESDDSDEHQDDNDKDDHQQCTMQPPMKKTRMFIPPRPDSESDEEI
ncbi:unnamed protein product [Oikopleura dioica]|uniref:Uncharacterized protein n=1 Tax=Oikopleura dioica TaxID=34765 RepID=E4Y253_OIKDI|nr:unnamed protein product [Oikopleura dioica]